MPSRAAFLAAFRSAFSAFLASAACLARAFLLSLFLALMDTLRVISVSSDFWAFFFVGPSSFALILVMSRRAKLYLLDEPIAGVDPATRDYILRTILSNFDGDATIIISTHLISDVEQVLSDVIFINNSQVVLCDTVDNIRDTYGKSVDEYFREVFRC